MVLLIDSIDSLVAFIEHPVLEKEVQVLLLMSLRWYSKWYLLVNYYSFMELEEICKWLYELASFTCVFIFGVDYEYKIYISVHGIACRSWNWLLTTLKKNLGLFISEVPNANIAWKQRK